MSRKSFPSSITPRFDTFFDSLFSNSRLDDWQTDFKPATNISEDKAGYSLTMAIPGMKKEDIKVEIDNNVLTVHGEKEVSDETTKEKFTRKEYSYNSFRRSFTLPKNANTETIDAEYTDGELKIRFAKLEETHTPTQVIEVV